MAPRLADQFRRFGQRSCDGLRRSARSIPYSPSADRGPRSGARECWGLPNEKQRDHTVVMLAVGRPPAGTCLRSRGQYCRAQRSPTREGMPKRAAATGQAVAWSYGEGALMSFYPRSVVKLAGVHYTEQELLLLRMASSGLALMGISWGSPTLSSNLGGQQGCGRPPSVNSTGRAAGHGMRKQDCIVGGREDARGPARYG